MFQHGDRIRVEMIADDGLPVVRYGFVVDPKGPLGSVSVLLDGEVAPTVMRNFAQLRPVTITEVELRLNGFDLLDDPALRQGLVNLWSAEAEEAGLEIASLQCIGNGYRDHETGYALAELVSGGEQYVLRAMPALDEADVVRVSAGRPSRLDDQRLTRFEP